MPGDKAALEEMVDEADTAKSSDNEKPSKPSGKGGSKSRGK